MNIIPSEETATSIGEQDPPVIPYLLSLCSAVCLPIE
jgi:hypothetical protein